MRSRSQQLLSKSIAAMVASVEIYNKPDFKYREESVAVLMVNAWELLFKAKWLKDRKNRLGTLYVRERIQKKDGSASKRQKVKLTRSGNPFTQTLGYLSKQLMTAGAVHANVGRNIDALVEIRDSAVHFYNSDPSFSRRLQEICTASVKNYAELVREWFDAGLDSYNFYTMPLSFMETPTGTDSILLNKEEQEQNMVRYLEELEEESNDGTSGYAVAIKFSVYFQKSKAVQNALAVQVVHDDKDALKVELTEEQVRERYPWDYRELTDKLRARYTDFKADAKYHARRRALVRDPRFARRRYLDPGNPKSSRKDFFNPNITQQFDEHYTRRRGSS